MISPTRVAAALVGRSPIFSRLLARAADIRSALQPDGTSDLPGPPIEHIYVAGELVPLPGIDVVDATDRPFHISRRRNAGDVIIAMVHESVTRSTQDAENVLRDRIINGQRDQLGVPLFFDPDGSVHQHNDVGDERLLHATSHNGQSAGLEVITPYYETNLRPGLPWRRVIDARWAHRNRYVVPTRPQLESLTTVVDVLIDEPALSITRKWPGLIDDRLAMGRVPDLRMVPGLQAHHYSGHADGAFPVLYVILRLEYGLDPADAYQAAITVASRPRWSTPRHVYTVDLRQYR